MDSAKAWLAVFLSVVLIGLIVITSLLYFSIDIAITNGLRLLSIFLGMLGGTALGEYLKIRNKRKAGTQLLEDVIEELRVNKGNLDLETPLRKGFWILGIRSGIAQNIPDTDRRKLWDIYSNITHYNDDLMMLHSSKYTNASREMQNLQDELIRLRTLIKNLIGSYFEFRGIREEGEV